MASLELTAPVRLYWDLSFNADESSVETQAPTPSSVCEQVIGSGVLFVALCDLGERCNPHMTAVAEQLLTAGRSVSITVRPSGLGDALVDLSNRDAGPRAQLLLHAGSLAELDAAIAAAAPQPDRAGRPGISFAQSSHNLNDLPKVVKRCLDAGISVLEVPIPRAADAPQADSPGYERLRRELLPLNRDGLRVILHDPFLWEAFHPEGVPQGGCQAGGGMLHIDPSYQVFPCAMMQLPLGQLGEGSLSDILGSKERLQIRQQLQDIPEQCRGCMTAGRCLGGCRGRAFLEKGELGGCDPACPGPRSA